MLAAIACELAVSVMPRLPLTVATPRASVTPLPAALPSIVNATDLPLTGLPRAVRVADRLAVPPYVAVDGATLSAVGRVSMKQVVTSLSVGVTAPLVVVNVA